MSAVATISPARKVAFAILLSMERGKAHSDELLRGKTVEALSHVDRNLVTTLVLGVLRWQIYVDGQIRGLLKKPGAKLDPEVRIALRLGVFQLEFLDRVPAHAAIDESVELAKQWGHRFASGMVNAVLRSAARGNLLNRIPDELTAVQAHPAWMVERWTRFYGPAAVQAICRHGQMQPPFTVRLAFPDAEAELARTGVGFEAGALLANARTVTAGDITATAVFREGRVRIQDEGSQLIAELAACANEDSGRKASSILDACAAPGGKTLILAERNPEARILACESSPRRFAELRERLQRFRSYCVPKPPAPSGFSLKKNPPFTNVGNGYNNCGTALAAHAGRVECRLADANALQEESAFDLALVDAPCSGTGTLGRNPEIRHRLRLEDFARHAERQRELLRAAIRCVRLGGRVVYSTCSLEPEENDHVVSAVLAENRNARLLSFAPRIESLLRNGILTRSGAESLQACLTPDGSLLLLPGAVPTDGFFVALIEKTD